MKISLNKLLFWNSFKSLVQILLGVFFLSNVAQAQVGSPYQLNKELVTNGDVGSNYLISTDNTRVIYAADQDTDGVNELYSVSITGGTVVKLNPTLVAGGNLPSTISSFQITPDSTRVIYRTNLNTDGFRELYSVPIAGGSAVKLNPTLVTGGIVYDFQITPDSTRVIYRADQDIDDVTELYSVPIAGGAAVKLNPTLVPGGNMPRAINYQISPDSTRVIYRADQDTDDVTELYSVPINGGAAIKLNTTLMMGEDIYYFQISPDNTRVVYVTAQDTDEVSELYTIYELHSVPISGGGVVKLNPTLVVGGDVFTHGYIPFQISPNSTRVIYIADQDTNGIFELYSVPIAGGLAIKLNPTLVTGGDVFIYQISPDSTRVIYAADQSTDTVNELYSVPIAGGVSIKLNPNLVTDGDVFFSLPHISFQISPDSARVIYRADQDKDEVLELYSAPIDGGAATKLSNNLPLSSDVNKFIISDDGIYVVYLADQNVFDENELFAHQLKEPDVMEPNEPEDGLCVPIKASNNKVAVVCL